MSQSLETIDKLERERTLSRGEFKALLSENTGEADEYLFARAREAAAQAFGNKIYIRGLIEFSSHCKQNCLYCGLRRDNRLLERYRLSEEEILQCCEEGHKLGFRTFVLQSGEDEYYTAEKMTGIIKAIRRRFPEAAITMGVGEKNAEVYKAYCEAGANRFLLRHESIDAEHYRKLHSSEREIETRVECLYALKKIGFQTGSGFMVGSPWQTMDNIIDDIFFLEKLQPEMIGIGPYMVNKDTPFKNESSGSLQLTLRLLAVLRLMRPSALLPATTALGSIHPEGREKGILAGANVIMPNLSPMRFRKSYNLYDGKICMEDNPAHCINCLGKRLSKIGYEISYERGDYAGNF